MRRPMPCRRRSDALTRCETRRGSTVVPRGRRKPAAWQDGAVRLSTFPHPRASTAIQWLICAFIRIVHRSMHRPLRWLARGWRDRSKLSGWPWDPLRARGAYDQGTRQYPPHQRHSHAGPRRGRQRHLRWQVHAHVGPDPPPGGGDWGQGQGRGLAIRPATPRTGTRCVGLALAPPPAGNCAAPGPKGWLGSGVAHAAQAARSHDSSPRGRGHGAHPASRRSTARCTTSVLITRSPGRRAGPVRVAAQGKPCSGGSR